MIETLAEGHVLAEKTGLGVAKLQELLAAMFPGPYMIFSKKMSTGDYYGKGVSLSYFNPSPAELQTCSTFVAPTDIRVMLKSH